MSSRSSRPNRGPVPNRWLNCPRKASGLIMQKFLAFKTPLSHNYDHLVPPESMFTPQFIFEYGRSNKLEFGLWIDLTNTNRFYDKSEIEQHDCRYLKLQCRGFGEAPSEKQTNEFIIIVDNFISKRPLKCIAVHCTHGFNRTGFLIVSYLREKVDCDLETALQMFADVRPPGIYKQQYLDELYRRYGNINDVPVAPLLPNWCEDEEQHDDLGSSEVDNEAPATSSSITTSSNQNHRRKNGKVPVFMEGVPGVEVCSDQSKAAELQLKVQKMCNWKKRGFPGCQPVSMTSENIRFLHYKPYRVSWKADGVRYMMLIDGEDNVYFFDRDHNVFKVNGIRFVHRKDLQRHLRDTLIDGEMVIDKVEGENIPRYLAYDIVMFEGDSIKEKPFYPTRLQYIEFEVINPRHQAMQKGFIKKELEPFSIRKKDFWDITQAASLLGEKFAKTLSHEPDGLIFQPSRDPYITGRCDQVLKWKPLELNSVDFRLKIVKTGGMGIVAKQVGHLYVGQCDMPCGEIKYTKALKGLDNKIIECKWEDNEWKFMRERTDKSFPNSYNTALGVINSIKHPISKEFLIDYIKMNKFIEMPPPPPPKKKRYT